ncbi:MAG: aspartate 1-decarboxylase, partial [Acidobacteriota bacterium]|nr:aspartate 1-decarboxylase [Acidobacteriota bacterium]
AAAHKIRAGDQIIIFAFGLYSAAELEDHKPKLVFVDEENNPIPDSAPKTAARTA